jgi:chaperonin GroES
LPLTQFPASPKNREIPYFSAEISQARRFCDMKVRPLNDRVLVIRTDQEEKTSGGIIIPDTAKEKPQEGRVVAVGSGKVNEDGKRIPLEIKENDRVLFSKYGGNEIKINGVEHVMIRADDVLAILE